jgi:hypothetical protein
MPSENGLSLRVYSYINKSVESREFLRHLLERLLRLVLLAQISSVWLEGLQIFELRLLELSQVD